MVLLVHLVTQMAPQRASLTSSLLPVCPCTGPKCRVLPFLTLLAVYLCLVSPSTPLRRPGTGSKLT